MGITTTLITSFIMSTTSTIGADTEINKPLIVSNIEEKQRKSTLLEEEYNNLIEKVKLFRTLENDWDGYGAIELEEKSITNAISFLNLLKDKSIIKPEVFPTTIGEASLYWRNNDDYIEISFQNEDSFSFFYDFGYDVYGEVDIDLSVLPEKLIYAINFIHNKTNSVEVTKLINSTNQKQRFLVA